MARCFHDDDADLSIIQGRRSPSSVTAARARASLSCATRRTSRVGLREGSKSRERHRPQGLKVSRQRRGSRLEADVIMCWRPTSQRIVTRGHRAQPRWGDALFFGHGLNIHFGSSRPRQRHDRHGRPRRALATWCAVSTSTARACPA